MNTIVQANHAPPPQQGWKRSARWIFPTSTGHRPLPHERISAARPWCWPCASSRPRCPSFEELGLLGADQTIAESPRGIVLVAGTTGCGKSTTLAAMIEHINANFKKHLITLEDPIEYVFEDNQSVIEQREIGLDTLSFHHGLKHMLRQDPDIIMMGEMRDAGSFPAAMSAADTGHLVLSTLHTTNAAQSVGRMLDFFPAEEREQVRRQLAGTLKAVICQRMVTTVTGAVTPAVEIMINTPTIRKLIEENRLEKLAAAIETGTDDGMQNFNHALFQLVKDGKVNRQGGPGQRHQPAGPGNEFPRHLPQRRPPDPRVSKRHRMPEKWRLCLNRRGWRPVLSPGSLLTLRCAAYQK